MKQDALGEAVRSVSLFLESLKTQQHALTLNVTSLKRQLEALNMAVNEQTTELQKYDPEVYSETQTLQPTVQGLVLGIHLLIKNYLY